MRQLKNLSGETLTEMLVTATNWLEKNGPGLDALNVFPVPDGDTGTNMLLTMEAAVREARSVGNGSVSRIADAVARGALRGAAGNSGVILSQFWQGIAEEFKGKSSVVTCELAEAFKRASDMAFRAVSKPVEGTILTVMKDIAKVALMIAKRDADFVALMGRIVIVAEEREKKHNYRAVRENTSEYKNRSNIVVTSDHHFEQKSIEITHRYSGK